ncbi:MAG: response regulator [Candidatus Omnitrophica bacterium]|nr:response regulator [Candidatus Omnitrophota bacterium]
MEKKKILIVDDEEKFGRMIKMLLDATGRYDVKIEPRGAQAIPTVRLFKPDLVFLDISMPDMDGAEVAARLKEDAVLKAIPVIFLTGMVLREETGPHSKIGGCPVLAKPVSADEIMQAIEKNLRQ